MRKLFTFLFAALMSVGMYATTEVTITNSDFPQHGTSFTKDGVTVSAGMIDGMDGNLMDGGSFSTTLGNFTKIEVTAMSVSMLSGEGWSGNQQKKTWTGNASSVSFSGDIMGMGMGTTTLKFTIAEPTVAVTGVTLNQNEAQMTVGGETLTLTATVNPNNATDQSVSWSTSDANVATVDNGVVTAVAAGTATITVTTTDGSFTATCAVTITAPEPAKYYVVGNMTEWAVDENYEMNPNIYAETEEYFYALDLTTTSEFKVVKVEGENQTWYPTGMGNNYGQNGEITEDAEYTIYFRPNYNGGEDWFYNCIYVSKNEPEPADEYAEIVWTEVVAKDDLAENATFAILGTEFSATIADEGNKMEIDANTSRFGTAEDYKSYTHRLKSGGASSSTKNFITLNIPEAGKIRIAVRTAANTATDRALKLEQGGTELYNAVVQESQAIDGQDGKIYPYVIVDVAAGSVRVSYTAGLNFYGFGFKAASSPTAVENTAVETKAIKRIVNGQLLIERNGKLFNVTGAQVR